MNLLSIVLYSRSGEKREVELRPGQLNIVTGWSRTGKSALLDIVEFCLGRRTATMPVGPITETVAWYAVLLQLPSTRAFVARPAPRTGRASTQQAMLQFGAELQAQPFVDLSVNADTATVREQLGRLIGIGENTQEPERGSLRHALEANLGHALLFCLQQQSEIADRELLFHRQGDSGIRQAITDTLPYFLGAVADDQTLKRQRLREARRELRRAETELAAAEQLNAEMETELRALLTEAHEKGLTPAADVQGREAATTALMTALTTPVQPEYVAGDTGASLRELEEKCQRLRRELRELADQRALLEQETVGEHGYQNAVRTGVSRLRSLDILPASQADDAGDRCPICDSWLSEPDPTVDDLRVAVDDLRSQLRGVETSEPRRARALSALDARTDELRQDLRASQAALTALRASDARVGAERERAEDQAFTKGRIDLYLSRFHQAPDNGALERLRERVELARRSVEQLESDLDPGEEREQITSRLMVIAEDMTEWAQRLQLEHRGRNVRLDLNRLTVVTDTDTGPAPLFRIGSAENWIGYHLIAHLALHRYFVRQGRPVPRLLMLDQPTQAYYPSDVEQRSGIPNDDDDRAAVRRLFELMRDVAAELSPELQIIVCDHANLPEPWFQRSVRHNWRGDALIPAEWIETNRAT